MAAKRRTVCKPSEDVCLAHDRPLVTANRCAAGKAMPKRDPRKGGPLHGRAAAAVAGAAKAPARTLDNQAARTLRLAEIEERIAKGEARSAIVSDLAERLKLSPRTIAADIAEIDDRYRAELGKRFPSLTADLHGYWMEQLEATVPGTKERDSALDKITKMVGGYAATNIKVSGQVDVAVSVRVQAESAWSVLDEEGRRCFAEVQRQFEAARARGALPPIDATATEVPSS